MNGAEDFYGAFGVSDGRLQKGGLISAPLAFRVSRTRVPRCRNYALVIPNGAVFDLNPVAQRAPGRLVETPALRRLRPSRRVPLLAVVDAKIAVGEIVVQLVDPLRDLSSHELRLDGTRGDPAERGKQCRSRRIQFSQYTVDQFLDFRMP